ncbi:unnamed protein product [Linum trigynum]|uniref:Uncharacterized protein n=1 Tax=Linum trigynum TaxID=586398 RepID=A0AAV2G6X7_9ROSI
MVVAAEEERKERRGGAGTTRLAGRGSPDKKRRGTAEERSGDRLDLSPSRVASFLSPVAGCHSLEGVEKRSGGDGEQGKKETTFGLGFCVLALLNADFSFFF